MNEILGIWSGEGGQVIENSFPKGGNGKTHRNTVKAFVLPSDSSASDSDFTVAVAVKSTRQPRLSCLSSPQSEAEYGSLWEVIDESRSLLQSALQDLPADHTPHHQATITTIENMRGKETGIYDSCVEYEASVEKLLTPFRANPSPSPSSFSNHLTPAMKAWVALLCTKTILYVTGDHQRAYKWVRKALSFLIPPRSSTSTSTSNSTSASSSTRSTSANVTWEFGSCLAVDRCLPKLEVSKTILVAASSFMRFLVYFL